MKDLLIDAGSTFIKYAFRESGKSAEVLRVPFPSRKQTGDERYFIDRGAIEQIFLGIVNEGVRAGCERLFISVQMHGFLWRRGEVISDYVSWRDQSGEVVGEHFREIDFNRRGTALKKNLPLCKKSLWSGADEFFTLGSFLAYLLTGENATHVTDACASGFYDAETGEILSPSSMKMPRALFGTALLGCYKGLAVYAPFGDHQISFLGSGAGADGYLLNIGTATQLSCLGAGYTVSSVYEARPYITHASRLCTVSGLTGGTALYEGVDASLLLGELERALSLLPPKEAVYIGGGGSGCAFEKIQHFFKKKGIKCMHTKTDIGIAGLKRVADEKTKVGTMLSELAFPNFPLIAKNTGLDFIIVDNEHGAFDFSALSALCMNASLVSLPLIIRLPDNSRATVTKSADMGAGGFLLPMTNTKEDAEKLVRYAKYAPVGERGVSTTRAHTHYAPPPLSEYMESANRRVHVYAQIETKEGVENVVDILSLDGVDGVFIGPNDLSVSLGCVGRKEPVYECFDCVARAASNAGKPWGVITADKELIAYAKRLSVDMISCGSELNMLINGCKKIKNEIQ